MKTARSTSDTENHRDRPEHEGMKPGPSPFERNRSQGLGTPDFDPVARFYTALERIAFGHGMQRCRAAFLREVIACRRVVIAGEGPGAFLAAFRTVNEVAEVDVIDTSIRMLRIAGKRVREADDGPHNQARTHFHHADILKWSHPDQECPDLVVTNFFLDCFEPLVLKAVINHLAGMAAENAFWLNADFQQSPTGLKAWRAKLWLRVLYKFFRVTTGLNARFLTAPNALLEQAGFAVKKRCELRGQLLYAELRQRENRDVERKSLLRH